MNAVSSAATETIAREDALFLRVLTGRAAGAQHRLPLHRTLTIGHSFEHDIVLRAGSTKGCSLRLATAGRRSVLTVVAGSVTVLGRQLGAGEEIQLEPYLPVQIGDIHFAVGKEQEARWEETLLSLDAEPSMGDLEVAEDCPRADIAERLELRTGPARETVSRWDLGPRVLAVAGAALLCVAAGSHFGSRLIGDYPQSPGEVRAGLAAAGFTGLAIEPTGDGERLAIAGLVRDEGQLGRLREWVAQNHPDALVEVETASAAAAAASDLLAAQNIDAVAQIDGANGLLVEGPFLPKDRQQELTELLRRDLPRVGRIEFRHQAGRGESDLAYFFNSPGYGAASFVAGDPGYLVTEDGTRWFAGASLPTGHKIVEIGEASVTVEREGLRDTLVM